VDSSGTPDPSQAELLGHYPITGFDPGGQPGLNTAKSFANLHFIAEEDHTPYDPHAQTGLEAALALFPGITTPLVIQNFTTFSPVSAGDLTGLGIVAEETLDLAERRAQVLLPYGIQLRDGGPLGGIPIGGGSDDCLPVFAS
jgi:hypothetical protein